MKQQQQQQIIMIIVIMIIIKPCRNFAFKAFHSEAECFAMATLKFDCRELTILMKHMTRSPASFYSHLFIFFFEIASLEIYGDLGHGHIQ